MRERRDTAHGWPVLLGVPGGPLRWKGGPQVIFTPELVAYLEAHRDASVAELELPLGHSVLKRLRAELGHSLRAARATWWREREGDLAALTTDAFAARHGRSTGGIAQARHKRGDVRQRPQGWWRAPEIASVLLADRPRAEVAAELGLSVGAVRRLRASLRASGPGNAGVTVRPSPQTITMAPYQPSALSPASTSCR